MTDAVVPRETSKPLIAFFRLTQGGDAREQFLVEALAGSTSGVRFDQKPEDFLGIDGAPLAYWVPAEVLQLFRTMPKLEPDFAKARQGKATGDDPRWVRQWWEVPAAKFRVEWVPFAKGGAFGRFHADVDLVLDWDPAHREALKASGNALPSESLYFLAGLTWPLAAKVFNARVLPEGCVFGHKGPAIFLREEKQTDYLLAVLNTSIVLYLLKARTPREEMGGRWEVGVIKKLPVPRPQGEMHKRIGRLARHIHDAKAAWDEGNEVCTRFNEPWLSTALRDSPGRPLGTVLNDLLAWEAALDADIQATYADLDTAVFDAYGLAAATREAILKDLGPRPPEVIWPQMEGKSAEQKRMEHVWRLLAFCVKRVIDGDDDGIVPLVKCSNEGPLEERVLAELGRIVGADRLHHFEGEVASDLRKRAAGYKRVDSIGYWLANVYFEFHKQRYKSRPIYWHLASSQEKDPAFGVLVHYHRFGKDALRKLRGTYVRGCLERFERDLGHARRENRAEDAIDLQRKMDEVKSFDKKLQGLEEGESPIRVPWKDEARQPKGWDPDIDDGVKVNILPLQTAGLLRIAKVVTAKSEDEE